MALEIRQNLKLSQQLVITPQLQQAIKLLQLSRMELLEMVHGELLENPVLEEEPEEEDCRAQELAVKEHQSEETTPEKRNDTEQEVLLQKEGEFKEPQDFDWENYLNTYNAPEHISSGLEELPSYENTLSRKETLHDHLFWQLRFSDLPEDEEEIGTLLVGSVNDDGYLQDPLEEIAEKAQVTLEKVEAVLKKIQQFDPLGVASRNLQECLIQQVRFYPERETLEKIIRQHLPDLERKDYLLIARDLKISVDQVVHFARIIHELEPKPGRPYSQESSEYITPDVYVYKVGEDWVVVLNEDGLPKLQISPFYKQMAKQGAAQDGAKEYVQNKLRSAVWLIRSIHQRQRTLYKVVKAIVKFQKDFFEKGPQHLKPMVLKDVAEEISMHESTVSRVTSSKYVHTPQGIFELKYFFNNGLPSSFGGDSVASEAIRDKIKHIISEEDPKSPYSDQHIVKILKDSNIEIARRTVAKYRESLKILPSSKRKQFF